MQLVEAFQLVVNGNQLVADVGCIFNPGKIIQHRFDLSLAGDQDAALRRSWFVGHRDLA